MYVSLVIKGIGTVSVKIIIVANIIKIIKITTSKPHLSEKRICPAASVQICRLPSFDHSGTQSQKKHRGIQRFRYLATVQILNKAKNMLEGTFAKEIWLEMDVIAFIVSMWKVLA